MTHPGGNMGPCVDVPESLEDCQAPQTQSLEEFWYKLVYKYISDSLKETSVVWTVLQILEFLP